MEVGLRKKRAAGISVLSNVSLVFLKLVVGIMSGSMSIISEAVHSASDLLASFLALFSVSRSSMPADKEHPFGHGKYEDFSGLLEGGLIIAASIYILIEAGKKLILYPDIKNIDVNIGIAVMALSVIVNIFVSRYLYKVARETDSIAIYADAEHLRTDVYSSLAVFGGLVIIKFTSFAFLDPIFAIFVALIIMHAGYKVCKTSLNNLLDGTLPDEDLVKVSEILKKHLYSDILSCSSIQTRKSGSFRTINLVLSVRENMTIKEGHEICDRIESEINAVLLNAEVVIHLEPCACGCENSLNC